MASQPTQLVNRWHFNGNLPEDWGQARKTLEMRLRELDRVLNVLHGAVEYPTVSYPTRLIYTADTTISSTSYTDLSTPIGATSLAITANSSICINFAFYVQCTTFGAAADTFTGTLTVNGTPFGTPVVTGFSALNDTRSVARIVQSNVSSGTTITIGLQGKVTGTSVYKALAGCAVHCLIIPNPYKVP